MAFGRTTSVTTIEETEKQDRQLYLGITPVRIVAVNPTKEEALKFGWNGAVKDPTSTYVDAEGNTVNQASICFLLKMDDSVDKDFVFPMMFNIRMRSMTSQSGKTKVIDQYGNTAWVTAEEGKNQTIPVSSKGTPLSITSPYRPMYDGEDKLIEFLKRYLGINDSFRYNQSEGRFTLVDEKDLPDCKAQLEHVKDYFKGNFSEIVNIWKANKNQLVKALFYIGLYKGYEYQRVYWKVMRADSSYYSEIDKAIQDDTKSGRLNDCTILAIPLQKYDSKEIQKTAQEQTKAGEMQMPSSPAPTPQPAMTPQSNEDDLPF